MQAIYGRLLGRGNGEALSDTVRPSGHIGRWSLFHKASVTLLVSAHRGLWQPLEAARLARLG